MLFLVRIKDILHMMKEKQWLNMGMMLFSQAFNSRTSTQDAGLLPWSHCRNMCWKSVSINEPF